MEKVIVCETGRQAGIRYVVGNVLVIDEHTNVVEEVEPSWPGWSKVDLQRHALLVDKIPAAGDPAPKGWSDWQNALR